MNHVNFKEVDRLKKKTTKPDHELRSKQQAVPKNSYSSEKLKNERE